MEMGKYTSVKKTKGKRTSVFSKNSKDTSVPPKESSAFKRILLSVNFYSLKTGVAVS